jgi:hypothetical protein
MGIVMSTTYRCARGALFALAAVLAAAGAQAQNISVSAANSINNKVYSLNFTSSGITTTVDNTDYKSFLSIESLAYLVNPATTALDLVVADPVAGKIAVYPGDFSQSTSPPAPTTATVIWTASQGGPVVPNGLTVDGQGDLWVVNQQPLRPQLWVFPAAGTNGCTPLASYAALCAPVLVDGNFPATELLVETTIVPPVPAGGAANTGDLLVLTFNSSTVLDYSFPTPGSFTFNRSTLITLPSLSTPAGMAFWPLDDSLLITNSVTNTILRYSCCSAPAQMANFGSAPGLLYLMFKIKTGYQGGAPYAFVAQTNLKGGDILEFGEGATVSGPGALLSTITQNVNEPIGLAVINAGSVAANACTSTNGGCNPTGLMSVNIPASTSPSLVQNVCVVPQDPRVSVVNNAWSCNGQPLSVNSVCPGFDTTGHMVIPGYFCGQSGDSVTSMQGFTLIKTLTNDSQINGVVVDNEGTVADEPVCVPGPGNNPTLAGQLWAPLATEGTFIADGLPNSTSNTNEMLDLTGGCGSVHTLSSGGSIAGLGFALNLAGVTPEGSNTPSPGGALGTLGDNKYQDLESQIETILVNPVISTPVANQLAAVTSSGNVGCVYLSQSYFDFAQLESGTQQTQDYTIAADLLSNASGTSSSPITCDSIVTYDLANVPNGFVPTSGPPPVYNPSGQVRSRLANLYFTINSRILGNQPNNTDTTPPTPAWPPVPAPAAPPSGFSTLPPLPDNQTPCVSSGYPPPGGCPVLTVPASVVAGTSVTASFTLYGSNNSPTGCTLSSTDGTFKNAPAQASPQSYPFSGATSGTVPAGASGNATYTLTCPFPDSAGAQSVTVSAPVTIQAPPTISATPTPSVPAGSPVVVSWVLNGSSACSLTSSDGAYTNSQVASGQTSVTYTPSVASGTTITYTLQCTAPSQTSVTAQVTITRPPATTVSVSPSSISDDCAVATITWTAPSGASACALTDSSSSGSPAGKLSGQTSGSGGSFIAKYTSGEGDAGKTITFTASCGSGATSSSGSVSVAADKKGGK